MFKLVVLSVFIAAASARPSLVAPWGAAPWGAAPWGIAPQLTKTIHYQSEPVVTGYSSTILKPNLGLAFAPSVTRVASIQPELTVQQVSGQAISSAQIRNSIVEHDIHHGPALVHAAPASVAVHAAAPALVHAAPASVAVHAAAPALVHAAPATVAVHSAAPTLVHAAPAVAIVKSIPTSVSHQSSTVVHNSAAVIASAPLAYAAHAAPIAHGW